MGLNFDLFPCTKDMHQKMRPEAAWRCIESCVSHCHPSKGLTALLSVQLKSCAPDIISKLIIPWFLGQTMGNPHEGGFISPFGIHTHVGLMCFKIKPQKSQKVNRPQAIYRPRSIPGSPRVNKHVRSLAPKLLDNVRMQSDTVCFAI